MGVLGIPLCGVGDGSCGMASLAEIVPREPSHMDTSEIMSQGGLLTSPTFFSPTASSPMQQ